MQVRKRGSTERLTLSNFGVGPGDALQLIQFISNHAGKTSVDGAQVDIFGNVLGSQYDLGVDGGFTGLRIAVLQFFTGEGFDFKLPQDVLEGKGFTVHRYVPDETPSLFVSGTIFLTIAWCGYAGGLPSRGSKNSKTFWASHVNCGSFQIQQHFCKHLTYRQYRLSSRREKVFFYGGTMLLFLLMQTSSGANF